MSRVLEPPDSAGTGAPEMILAQSPTIHTGLLFGVLLLSALVMGRLARVVRVPRVVGYLVAGAIVQAAVSHWTSDGPSGKSWSSQASASLGAVKDLALGLILFTIGGVFEARHMRSVGRAVLRVAVCETLATGILVFLGVLVAGLLTRGLAHEGGPVDGGVVFALALLVGSAAIATAPAATLFVLREYQAKGPVTDAILSLTGINNVVCVVLFQIVFFSLAAAGALPGADPALAGRLVWLDLLATTGGSLLVGGAVGLVMSLVHARFRAGEAFIALMGVVLVLVAGERVLLGLGAPSYNFLLTALTAGAVFSNVAIDPGRLEEAAGSIGQPIYVGFFVIAGFQLHLGELATLGAIGGAYIVCRLLGKCVGVWLGLRWLGGAPELSRYLGAALLCQAAVVIGLADFVARFWPHPWAAHTFATTVLGSVVFFEAVGPIATRLVVVRSGEVKAVRLIRRSDVSEDRSPSLIGLTLGALLRTLGLGSAARTASSQPLAVKDVMRANVKCLPAAARFDEVLRFVESSRFADFPVVDEHGDLIGVIHFRDIREIIYRPALSDLVTAADLVAADTKPVPPAMPLDDLLDEFRVGHASALPVVESEQSRRVIGVVEQRDVLRALHRPLD